MIRERKYMADDCTKPAIPEPLWERMTAYHEGRAAQMDGLKAKDNPFLKDRLPLSWSAWYRGWLSAEYKTK